MATKKVTTATTKDVTGKESRDSEGSGSSRAEEDREGD